MRYRRLVEKAIFAEGDGSGMGSYEGSQPQLQPGPSAFELRQRLPTGNDLRRIAVTVLALGGSLLHFVGSLYYIHLAEQWMNSRYTIDHGLLAMGN